MTDRSLSFRLYCCAPNSNVPRWGITYGALPLLYRKPGVAPRATDMPPLQGSNLIDYNMCNSVTVARSRALRYYPGARIRSHWITCCLCRLGLATAFQIAIGS